MCCSLPSLLPSPPDAVRLHYEKHEYSIPMRDGATLFTAVYTPRDQTRDYPFLLTRTPYGIAPYGEDAYPAHTGPVDELATSGYIFVYQDIRSRYRSGGQYVEFRPHLDDKPSQEDWRFPTSTTPSSRVTA